MSAPVQNCNCYDRDADGVCPVHGGVSSKVEMPRQEYNRLLRYAKFCEGLGEGDIELLQRSGLGTANDLVRAYNMLRCDFDSLCRVLSEYAGHKHPEWRLSDNGELAARTLRLHCAHAPV